MNSLLTFLFTIFFVSFLSACGGGSSGSSSDGAVVADTSDEGDSSSESSIEDSSDNSEGACNLDANEEDMLTQVNAARTSGYQCGADSLPSVVELSWSCVLEEAARSHSNDMATNNFFSHTGSDGLSVSNRVDATGYEWSTVGENIAAGQSTVTQVVQGWLNSEGHCRNIMNANFTELGAERVDSTSADFSTYWTQVFAAPRQ